MRAMTLYGWLFGMAVFCLLGAGLLCLTGRYWGFPLDYGRGEDMDLFLLCLPPISAVLGSAAYGLATRSTKKRRRVIARGTAVLLASPIFVFILAFALLAICLHISNLPNSTTYFSGGDFKAWVALLASGLICAMTYVLSYLEGLP